MLLISDGELTEVVQAMGVTPGEGAGNIQVRPPLRFGTAANRNLFKRVLEGAYQPRHRHPPGAAGPLASTPIVLDSPALQGEMLMVGAGPDVEFVRLDAEAAAGAPVAITPPLRNNHPAMPTTAAARGRSGGLAILACHAR